MERVISYNYKLILKNLVQYLPSKVIVILNSFFIIPILTYFLNVQEVSVYLIALQILNIFCTCSSDWISKAVLRFYEKYRLENIADRFLSTIFWLSASAYGVICLIMFFLRNNLANHFAVSTTVLFLVGILLVPCAVRQNLYQILRIKNNYNLYTLSIIIYQLLFIAMFIALAGLLPNACGIIIAMISAIAAIDLYVIKTMPFEHKIKLEIDTGILKEVLKYGLPLIITNAGYWLVVTLPKLIFQFQGKYIDTSILGLGWTISGNMIEPIAGLFIFVNFPIIIKLFEHSKNIKIYFTNVIQLYFYIIFPLLFCLFFYAEDIVNLILPNAYNGVKEALPYFAVIIFFHQLLKLINVKYHLQNKTYLETCFSTTITVGSVLATMLFLDRYSVEIALLIMLITEILFFIVNAFIKLKNMDYLSYSKLLKTALCMLFLCSLSYTFVNFIFTPVGLIFKIIKISMYFIMCYMTGYYARKYILT